MTRDQGASALLIAVLIVERMLDTSDICLYYLVVIDFIANYSKYLRLKVLTVSACLKWSLNLLAS